MLNRVAVWTIPAPFLRHVVARTILVWAGLRLGLFLIFHVGVLVPSASLLLAGVAALVATLDGRRRQEHLFLANLGISPLSLAAAASIASLAVEVVFSVLT